MRTCVIPKGKPVFFPLINDEESFAEKQAYLDFSKSAEKGEFGQKGGEAMRIATSEDVDNMIKLEATFDEGTDFEVALLTGRLCKNRVTTDIFDVDFPEDNIFDGKPGPSRIVSDGYWIFLKPPPEGSHTLHFSGLEDDYGSGVTYKITVK